DVGQILSQEFERRVDGEAEMAREFLRLRIAENGLELIFSNRKIGARPEPGLHLGVKPALLQRGDETVEIAVLRLGQHRIDDSRPCRRLGLDQASLQQAAEIEAVQQAHSTSSTRLNPPPGRTPEEKPSRIKPDAPEARDARAAEISAQSRAGRKPEPFC